MNEPTNFTDTTAKYEVEFTKAAARQVLKLPNPTQNRIIEAIENLANSPRPRGCKKLVGEEAWRIRVGDYRVIYEIEDKKLSVTVVRAGHRREIYE
ncbi:MAG: type II toxin-antitoxin system RelE/ParE family toxin [Cellulomonadaceae bacterium]|jgi:mRNA interferase RelE/StbE|nr:type II toxin-antitoxin system RelE/ParE family toxin [Cellulomonadaceae bacterium]